MADMAGGIGGDTAAVLGTGPGLDWQPTSSINNKIIRDWVMEQSVYQMTTNLTSNERTLQSLTHCLTKPFLAMVNM